MGADGSSPTMSGHLVAPAGSLTIFCIELRITVHMLLSLKAAPAIITFKKPNIIICNVLNKTQNVATAPLSYFPLPLIPLPQSNS